MYKFEPSWGVFQYSASFNWWMLCYFCVNFTVACITSLLLLPILVLQEYNFYPFLLQTSLGSRSVVLRKPGKFWGLDVGTRASPALNSTKTPAAGRTTLNFCLTKPHFDLFIHICLTFITPTATAFSQSASCTSAQRQPCTSASKLTCCCLFWMTVLNIMNSDCRGAKTGLCLTLSNYFQTDCVWSGWVWTLQRAA